MESGTGNVVLCGASYVVTWPYSSRLLEYGDEGKGKNFMNLKQKGKMPSV
jgi:hypothetical protein